jgi:hypothetical protein
VDSRHQLRTGRTDARPAGNRRQIILSTDIRTTAGGRPPATLLRNVEDMTSTSSPVPGTPRRELSSAAAALLTIGGSILVVGIAALGVAGIAIAALAVFGGSLLEAL